MLFDFLISFGHPEAVFLKQIVSYQFNEQRQTSITDALFHISVMQVKCKGAIIIQTTRLCLSALLSAMNCTDLQDYVTEKLKSFSYTPPFARCIVVVRSHSL